MKCPLCNENDLEIRTNKKGEKTLCCEEWKPMLADELDKNSWENFGDCDFRIPFNNKLWGKMSMDDIKSLMSGEKIENDDGHTIELDLENQYFTKITFGKVEKFEL